MKIKVWVVTTCIPERGEEPCIPDVFATEAAAEAYADQMLRAEWENNAEWNDEGTAQKPYPCDWREANAILREENGEGSWGEWQVTAHEIEIGASPEALTLRERALPDNQVRNWIDACNHEPARETLRELLAYRVRGYAMPLSEYRSHHPEAQIGIPLGGAPGADPSYLDRFPPEARVHADRAYQDGYVDAGNAADADMRAALSVFGKWTTDVATLGELADLETRLKAVGVTLQQVGEWSADR